MNVAHQMDDEQTKLWNGVAGRAWVEAQDVLDQMFKPVEELLAAAVGARSGNRVLDVGCGTGSTTLTVARLLGANGHCAGIDISEPMIAAARARAERDGTPARFICGNAQIYTFEPAGVDTIISRFGVMFFDDPVRAFANLRRAAADNAALRFVAWRSVTENPFMTTAERAAAAVVPDIPVRQADTPGQFGFADQRRIDRILSDSGWTGIDIQPIDVPCTLPEKGLIGYFTRFGPLGRMLDESDEQTRARVIETVRPAFDPYVHGAEVHFDAACWMVSARSSSSA
jgi:SAM-dependent methyltransferase